MPTNNERPPRLRRDEDRRDRIIAAALNVIRTEGVSRLTLRRVASEAHVPLGSMTYHFENREEIIEAAFDLAMRDDVDRFAEWFQALPPGTDLAAALSGYLVNHVKTEPQAVYGNYELALAAVHRPELQPRVGAWAAHIAAHLAGHVPQEIAEVISVLYDGLLLRQVITGSAPNLSMVESSFRTALGSHGTLGPALTQRGGQ